MALSRRTFLKITGAVLATRRFSAPKSTLI
jgi:hypothetical protein